ncbi:MAG: GNAT family N-acetyltransferase [Propionicimonas sp.]|nr:GNAT family N-acetyltransferase [Propionicimonas sp.]MEA5116165.1 GNAT family N-acetyltransferase [Propionicimonas sp.]
MTEAPARGVVKFWKADKGWGAISSSVLPPGRDAFAHFSVVELEGFQALSQGQLVEFGCHPALQDGSSSWPTGYVRSRKRRRAGASIRPATTADGEWLKSLHRAAYAVLSGQLYDERSDAWQRGFFSARIAHPADVFVVSQGGTAVGAVYLETRADSMFVESLEVLPEYQNRGAGSAALSWVVDRAAHEGLTVTLQAHKLNTRARNLYERLGFFVVSETETHVRLQSRTV